MCVCCLLSSRQNSSLCAPALLQPWDDRTAGLLPLSRHHRREVPYGASCSLPVVSTTPQGLGRGQGPQVLLLSCLINLVGILGIWERRVEPLAEKAPVISRLAPEVHGPVHIRDHRSPPSYPLRFLCF